MQLHKTFFQTTFPESALRITTWRRLYKNKKGFVKKLRILGKQQNGQDLLSGNSLKRQDFLGKADCNILGGGQSRQYKSLNLVFEVVLARYLSRLAEPVRDFDCLKIFYHLNKYLPEVPTTSPGPSIGALFKPLLKCTESIY